MGRTIQVYGFPSTVTPSEVTQYLESRTATGSVYAVKVKKTPGRKRAYALVQFTAAQYADQIVELANQIQRLWYHTSYLKARGVDNDIIPKPRAFLHGMEDIKLHFGLQIAKQKFSSFWNASDVFVNFGRGLRRLHFYLYHHGMTYKLELSYENIWQIELHRPRGRASKYLIIQLFGAPRIFEKDGPVSWDPVFSYVKERSDDQWIRTTDFTLRCHIGHSSAICLELPAGHRLPNLRDNFPFFRETEGNFVLDNGSTFTSRVDLVPIVGPPNGIELPFDILFKVNLLVQNGCLPGLALDANFYGLVDPRKVNIDCIELALEKLFHLKECCYEPTRWLDEQYKRYLSSRKPPRSPKISLDAGLVYMRRVQVTPCKVYFCGPEVNVSNRVLRHFRNDIDNFLRVSFVDEDLEKMYSTDVSSRSNGKNAIYKRILSVLRNGILIGDKKFEFLAFSSSQLRENSCWMFASRTGLTASDIREWMGDFRQIRNVAKYAARLGQSFGSSTVTLSVARHEVEEIPDVVVERVGKNYVFSDGIGKISADFARKVASKCRCKGFTPSAFQIRYAGYKGVVAVDPMSSKKLSLRKSMLKYESDNTKLDVLAYSKYQPCFLNRQIITLLSTLGVPDHVFEKMQKEAVDRLDAILTDPLKARETLELMAPGEITTTLKEMLLCGYQPDEEPFLSMMLQTFRASKLLDLRTKTKVFIPNARSMLGCLDETGKLEYGEVFVQLSSNRRNGSYKRLIKDRVIVAKNPCLHPGDIRVLRAVNVPALHHMVDCVVFPQKGPRPHPNECSGSDLDGDIYFVCWDPDLIPPQQDPPMDYDPEPTIQLDHDVEIEEVEEYFTNYIVNDSLGIIANAHTVFADKDPRKARSKECIELARKFSIAVDFPKTGVPAEIPAHLFAKEYPDFMEKHDKSTYKSHNVIGKMFRAVKDISPLTSTIRSFTIEVAHRCYDADMEVNGFEDYIEDAFYHKNNYDSKLGNHLDYYGIKSEAEFLSGCIMNMSKSFTKRRDAEAIGMAIRSLRKEARSWFHKKGSGLDSQADDLYAKASAWYHVTYHPDYCGCYNEGMKRDHYLSFAWCVYDKLIQIKKAAIKKRNLKGSSLENMFSRSLRLRYNR